MNEWTFNDRAIQVRDYMCQRGVSFGDIAAKMHVFRSSVRRWLLSVNNVCDWFQIVDQITQHTEDVVAFKKKSAHGVLDRERYNDRLFRMNNTLLYFTTSWPLWQDLYCQAELLDEQPIAKPVSIQYYSNNLAAEEGRSFTWPNEE